MKSIKTIKTLVEETLNEFSLNPGSRVEPDMVPFVPHSMWASNPSDEEVESPRSDRANELYKLAFAAREATELLTREIQDPIFDEAYEHAFKATTCLRNVLNNLIEMGAAPDPDEMVVAPRAGQQKYTYRAGGSDFMPSTYSGGDV